MMTDIKDDYYDVNLLDPPGFLKKKDDMNLDVVYKKAYKDAHYQFARTAYLRALVSDASEGKVRFMPTDNECNDLLNDAIDRFSQKPPYILITINPFLHVTLEEFQRVICKIVNKKSIESYMYVYEIGKNDNLHCHMIVKYNDRPYNFKRGIKSTCKNICDFNNPHVLNFKFIKPENLDSKISYLLGHKSDKKQLSIQNTNKFRSLHSLEPYYQSNPPLPCRITQLALEDDSNRLTPNGSPSNEH